MITMPRVSYSDQFSAFMSFVKDEIPNVHDRIWAAIKRDLDLVHFDHCFGDEAAVENASASLLEYAECKLSELVGGSLTAEINHRLKAYTMHCEVSQAMDCEPWEEAAIWEVWERSDAQSAFQDKVEMYRGEF
ncbi:MAG: hypothetical protein ACRDBQ_21455 [Shewanella sp.]